MFTGIVAAVGKVVETTPLARGVRLAIDAGDLDLADVGVGDSIAVDGVCLTVVAHAARTFSVEVSPETLACTSGFAAGAEVNLEKALRLSDRLGGHFVSGHVDGTGEVVRVAPAGENRLLAIRAPDGLVRYIARKGSITVNGVSLTVNEVRAAEFTVNLIPHTVQATNLKGLKPGMRVNLEVDLLARYLDRLNEHCGKGG